MGKIVFFGDSLTEQEDVQLAQRWPQIVGLAAGYAAADIINAGIDGNRSDQMLARLQADVLAHSPDVVVMMFTVNDKVNSRTLAQHEAAYRDMIGQCQAAGAKVVLLSPPIYRSATDTWETWQVKWAQIAAEMGCTYIDVWGRYAAKSIAANSTFTGYYVDVVHQNAAGNAFIASVCLPGGFPGMFVKGTVPPEEPSECPDLAPIIAEVATSIGEVQAVLARLQNLQSALDSLQQ